MVVVAVVLLLLLVAVLAVFAVLAALAVLAVLAGVDHGNGTAIKCTEVVGSYTANTAKAVCGVRMWQWQ